MSVHCNDDKCIITDDSLLKASILNEYISTAFSRDNGQKPITVTIRCADADKFQNMCFTSDMVLKQLHSTKQTRTTGVDRHPAIFYVKCSSGLASQLSILYNLSLSTTTIPSDSKRSVITLVF